MGFEISKVEKSSRVSILHIKFTLLNKTINSVLTILC